MVLHGIVAHCSKCEFKHQRPVGVRCRRNLNLSAPVIADSHDDQPEQHSSRLTRQRNESTAGSTAPEAPVEGNTSKVSQVESALDLILKKYRTWKVKTSNWNKNFKITSPQQAECRGLPTVLQCRSIAVTKVVLPGINR